MGPRTEKALREWMRLCRGAVPQHAPCAACIELVEAFNAEEVPAAAGSPTYQFDKLYRFRMTPTGVAIDEVPAADLSNTLMILGALVAEIDGEIVRGTILPHSIPSAEAARELLEYAKAAGLDRQCPAQDDLARLASIVLQVDGISYTGSPSALVRATELARRILAQ